MPQKYYFIPKSKEYGETYIYLGVKCFTEPYKRKRIAYCGAMPQAFGGNSEEWDYKKHEIIVKRNHSQTITKELEEESRGVIKLVNDAAFKESLTLADIKSFLDNAAFKESLAEKGNDSVLIKFKERLTLAHIKSFLDDADFKERLARRANDSVLIKFKERLAEKNRTSVVDNTGLIEAFKERLAEKNRTSVVNNTALIEAFKEKLTLAIIKSIVDDAVFNEKLADAIIGRR
jgi:hypothetical protein